MKLRKVTHKEEANYPSFDDYHANRRTFMKTVTFAMGGIVLAGAGCSPADAGDKVSLSGEPPAPQPRGPVHIEGDIAIAEPPKLENGQILGRIATPRQPVKKPPTIKGAVVASQPPPRKAGEIPAPQPPQPLPGKPKPVDPPDPQPQLRGNVKASPPPKKDAKAKVE